MSWWVMDCDQYLWLSWLMYLKSYDYTLEKVKLYTRIPLGDIVGISKGQLNLEFS